MIISKRSLRKYIDSRVKRYFRDNPKIDMKFAEEITKELDSIIKESKGLIANTKNDNKGKVLSTLVAIKSETLGHHLKGTVTIASVIAVFGVLYELAIKLYDYFRLKDTTEEEPKGANAFAKNHGSFVSEKSNLNAVKRIIIRLRSIKDIISKWKSTSNNDDPVSVGVQRPKEIDYNNQNTIAKKTQIENNKKSGELMKIVTETKKLINGIDDKNMFDKRNKVSLGKHILEISNRIYSDKTVTTDIRKMLVMLQRATQETVSKANKDLFNKITENLKQLDNATNQRKVLSSYNKENSGDNKIGSVRIRRK